MGTVTDLADAALAISHHCLDAHRTDLLTLAAGDSELVRLVAARVRSLNGQRRGNIWRLAC